MSTVYLDQWVWIELARVAAEASVRPAAAEALRLLRGAVAQGDVAVPLSGSHYLETWHRRDWRSRHAVAQLMRELSQWKTLAPPEVLAREEVRVAVAGICGHSLSVPDPLGHGVDHAFASETGRFRFVESIWTATSEEGPPVQGIDLALASLSGQNWEWFNLAGPAEDFPIAELDGLIEWRPEHRRGDQWAAGDAERAAKLDRARLWHRLHDVLLTEDFVTDLLDDFNAAAEEFGLDVVAFGAGLRERLVEFHDSLPSRATLVALQEARLRDRSRPTAQHDRTDLLGLLVAIPYCDVVVTERQWSHLASAAGLPTRFGTTVISTFTGLIEALERRST
jgi:hypothetical protein